jgi:hypothetical protein
MSTIPTRILGGITVPDTPLITSAIAYAKSEVSAETFNHVMRSWLFGHYIADHIPDLQDRDVELHAITAILHDLGWAPKSPIISTDKRFEVDGANAAREFLIREGEGKWDKHRLQLAWDAIALHSSASIAMYKEVEVRVCCIGIFTDFSGWEKSIGGVLIKEAWQGIVKEFPRDGFKESVVEILCGLCKTKPATTYDNFVSEFGTKYVEGYNLEGKKFMDIVESMAS